MITVAGKKPSYYINIVVVFCFMFFFGFLPAPAPITPYGMQVLGIFIGVVYGWCVCDLSWPSLLALPAIGITAYGNTQTVFAGVFGNPNWVVTLLSFLMFAPIISSGLSEWIGMKLVTAKITKGKPMVLLMITYLGSFILSIFISGLIIILFLSQIFTQIFKQLGYQKGDKFVAMALTPIFFSSGAASILLPFYNFPLAIFGMGATVGIHVNNTVNYMLYVFIITIALLICWMLLMKLVGCDFSKMAQADFSEYEQRLKAPLNKEQKAIGASLICLIIGLMVIGLFARADGSAFQVFLNNVGVYGFLAAYLVVLIFIPVDGKPLLDLKEAASSVNWDFVFLMGFALFMSSVLVAEGTGIGAFAVKLFTPILASMGEYGFLLLLTVVTIILTNLGNNVVVIMTMVSVVMVLVSQGMAINGTIALVIILFCGMNSGFLLPSSSMAAALIYGSDLTDTLSLIHI